MRVIRYVRQYFKPSNASLEVLESSYTRDDQTLPATVYRPANLRGRTSAWIVLHGLTYHGSRHKSLQKFASAMAAGGHVVFVPEIPEWSRLLVQPALTALTIKASLAALAARDDVDAQRIGVFGFSFGATQSVVATHDEVIAKGVRAVVAWGGYADLGRFVSFGMTGDHELDGIRAHIDPDPYGRWIVGANYLTSIPGYEDMGPVAEALHNLALEAGRSGIFAGDPIHEPAKARLGAPLHPRGRAIYDLFAPVGANFNPASAALLAQPLARAIASRDPLMDPAPYFDRIRIPVLLAHGRDDRLIPYTETLRMRRRVPPPMLLGSTITSLFSHSGRTEPGLGVIGVSREAARFLIVMNKILTIL